MGEKGSELGGIHNSDHLNFQVKYCQFQKSKKCCGFKKSLTLAM